MKRPPVLTPAWSARQSLAERQRQEIVVDGHLLLERQLQFALRSCQCGVPGEVLQFGGILPQIVEFKYRPGQMEVAGAGLQSLRE